MKYHHININVKIVGAAGKSEFGKRDILLSKSKNLALREAQKVVFQSTEIFESDRCSQFQNTEFRYIYQIILKLNIL